MFWTLLIIYITYKLLAWAVSRIRIGNFSDKFVVITGCDSGFGNELTKRLDGLGFNVFASCLTSEGASQLQEACSQRVTTFLLDVTDEKSIEAGRQFVESKLPAGKGIWGLVNNAGVAGFTFPMEWQTRNDWDRCLSVNLFGVISMTRFFMPLLRKGQGRVVNMSSMVGRIVAASGPYCVSKYGVEAFSDSLRRETYDQGIKVCMLEPGYFKTDILNLTTLISAYQKGYDSTPDDIKKHYPHFSVERFAKLIQRTRDGASDDIGQVIDALELALTSRFPPTRQLVGKDARFIAPILWNLPAPITDWLFNLMVKMA